MKICFVTTVSTTLRAFVTAQAEYINKKHPDWQISFICDNDLGFAGELPKYINYIPVCMSRGVDVKGIKTIFLLAKIFKKEKYDMIVYATPNAALYSSFAGKLAGIKRRVYCQWGIRYVGFSGVARFIFKTLEKIICALSTNINAVSIKNRDFAINEKLYKAKKATVVGNGGTIGVDLTEYDIAKREEWRKQKRKEVGISDEFVFGFVGRLSRDKGVAELLGTTKELSKKAKIKLLCVGENELSDNAITDQIKDWIKSSGVVIFTGQKTHDEVKKYYAAMDAYVHPTYREGFGMVLQEAAAMQCPVITTNIPGASEVLPESEACILAEPRDTETLKNAMQTLAFNEALCKEIGNRARAYVEEKYERSLMLDNQLKRYEELLGV